MSPPTSSFKDEHQAWFKTVMRERFGVDFRIETNAETTMRLASSDRYISFANQWLAYCRPSSKIPCTYWKPESEGFVAPIEKRIAAPGLEKLPDKMIEPTSQGYKIHFDILSFALWMMSRYEETVSSEQDLHQRFPIQASHAFQHGYVEQPIVDEWFEILRQVIRRTWPNLTVKNPEFAQVVSHDVDSPSAYMFKDWATVLRMSASLALKHRKLGESLTAIQVRGSPKASLNVRDPANTFDWIFRVSQKHNLRDAFYFICGVTNKQYDGDYDIQHPALRQLLRDIHQRGHEIGLHPSYETLGNGLAFSQEADLLRNVCAEENIHQDRWGGRMHYLRWSHPRTAYLWEHAGMDYDSTAGYADSPGFRCGTCFDFPAFDPIAGQMFKLRIRPLVAMDVSVISEAYLGLIEPEAAFQKFVELKEKCRRVGGSFTLLWHNSELITDTQRELYDQVVGY